MIRLQVRRYGRFIVAIAILAIAATASGVYILVNQRLETPLSDRYTIYADLETASGLNPGLGQAVDVAGVRVGQISGARLVDGMARISLEIDPRKLPHVYDNATAALVPNTPLKDMIMEIGPGGPPGHPLRNGGVIPEARTDPPIDSDELTNALDADTRDFLDLLVDDSARGLAHRGGDVNRMLRALQPTAQQVHRITAALAARRHALKRLVGNLAVLSKAAGDRDAQIGRVVESANATLRAVAGEDPALAAGLNRLPGTLGRVRAALPDVAGFSRELTPTLDQLLPATRALPGALRALGPLATEATPIVRDKLRPLVRQLQPLAGALKPVTRNLYTVTPTLTVAFQVLNYVVDELAYNPPGDDEGFLYWTAWFSHDASSVLSTGDAHGAVFRGLVLSSCDALKAQPSTAPLAELIFGAQTACKTG